MHPSLGRSTSQVARQARTAQTARRRTEPWSLQEHVELAACHDDEALEDFAARWGRTFNAVTQRRRRPRPGDVRTGTGWIR
ncbi:hypothetical protein [Kineococcus terrestris]|uniref:hypothetical protein n=1 Tax=Kineococcus terrestris TaxID=2044856 RepID=UPI0034DB2CD4